MKTTNETTSSEAPLGELCGTGPQARGELSAREKYLHKPFYGSSHWWAAGHARPTAAKASVLDIGCGSGGMGRELRAAGASRLTAVEIDPDARTHARTIYDRVEESLDPLGEEQFDIILLLDLLEHLVDPEGMLRRVARLVAEGGCVIVSVPNITHWSVRTQILAGRFPLTDRGILDRTHLAHFDRKRFVAMVSSAPPLRVERLGASIAPAEFVLPRWAWENSLFHLASRARHRGAELMPGLFAYQHLAILRRP